MSQFQDLQVSGLLQANQGSLAIIAANGFVPTQSEEGTIALVTGNNDDVPLPQFKVPGAMAFSFSCTGAAVLRSIAPALPGGVRMPVGAMCLLINTGTSTVTTTANTGGTVGNRFSLAVQLQAGTACWFVYSGALWFPVFPITPGG